MTQVTAEPRGTYEGLLIQFEALKTKCNQQHMLIEKLQSSTTPLLQRTEDDSQRAERYEKALESIMSHQEMVCGSRTLGMYGTSHAIAKHALENT